MILQKNTLNYSHTSSVLRVPPNLQTTLSELSSLLKTKIAKRILLPTALIEELEDFTERNSLAIMAYSLPDRKPIHKCCPQCLKAHIIKTAKDLKIGKHEVKLISSLFNCKAGHNGYYLDLDNLVKTISP
jgi:hypothetical protein